MFKKVAVVVLLVSLLIAASALAVDPISIEDSGYKLVSVLSSGHYVTWSWKVRLHNFFQNSYRIKLKVQLVDFSGYEVRSDLAYCDLGGWETKTLTGQGIATREEWEKVSSANYLLETR